MRKAETHDTARAGIVEDVRTWLGERVVEVRVIRGGPKATRAVERRGTNPHELFDEFLIAQGVDDPRLAALFSDLLDAETNA